MCGRRDEAVLTIITIIEAVESFIDSSDERANLPWNSVLRQTDAATPDVEYPPLTKGIWTQITVPAAPNTSLHGVWTDGTTRVALAGTNGSVIVNDGLGWKVATQGKFPTLNGVAGGKGAGHTFAVGVGGTIIGGKGQDGAPGLNWGPPGGCTKGCGSTSLPPRPPLLIRCNVRPVRPK